MTVSQNGYKAFDSTLIATYTIPKTTIKISLRKGYVSVVLLDFASWYHFNIEPLTQADTGGYNPRSIIGSSTPSNHASGTAEDLRWNKHVRGVHNTFTAEQKTKITNRLKIYEGVIRWGEYYVTAPIDGMHYEINKPPADVERVAKKILLGQRVARELKFEQVDASLPILLSRDSDHVGYTNTKTGWVGRLQKALGVPVNGEYDTATVAAVKAKMSAIDPTMTGKTVDMRVWEQLYALWGAAKKAGH